VTKLAKAKTTVQMLALGFLIVGVDAPSWIPSQTIGEVGIWIAAVITLITGYDYLKTGLKHMMQTEPPLDPAREAAPAASAAQSSLKP
jgi:cardiolipin synthase